jgi:TPP-dependent indolepyruvate ferredoxin oxidoreductase alpha subunit
MMERYMRTKATDPALAAQSYSTEMKAAATTMAAYKQDIFDNKMSISEAVMKGTDTLINSEVYAGLDDDEKEIMKLQIFAPLESLMTADEFTKLVGGIDIPEEGDNTLERFIKATGIGGGPKTVSYSAQDGDPLQGSPDANKQQRLQSEIMELEQKGIDQQPPLLVDQDGNLRGPTPQEAIRQRQQGLGRGGEFIRNKEERQNADSEKLKSLDFT